MTERDIVERLRNFAASGGMSEPTIAFSLMLDSAAAEILRLRAALAEYEWKPIETAPRDGTEILISDPDGSMDVVHWRDGISESGWWVSGRWCSWQPTYWRPLPDPPDENPATREDGKP